MPVESAYWWLTTDNFQTLRRVKDESTGALAPSTTTVTASLQDANGSEIESATFAFVEAGKWTGYIPTAAAAMTEGSNYTLVITVTLASGRKSTFSITKEARKLDA